MIYAIGDIHGQQTMLKGLLDYLRDLPLHDEDTLVFVGDYVDRGENSRAVLETLLELKAERENVVFLRGNHEQLMLDAYDSPGPEPVEETGVLELSEELQLWIANGGIETLTSYQPEMNVGDLIRWRDLIPEPHWEFLRATEREHITERYHFVHAGLLPPGKTWEAAGMNLDPRLWIREPFLESRDKFGGRIVVFGHTPQMNGRPLIQRNKIGLDTGAVFGGPLTCAVLNPEPVGRKLPPPRFFQIDYMRMPGK